MNEKDYLLKIMDKDKQIRIFLAHTTALVEEAHQRHETSATASAALGRVLTGAVMMGSDLKGEKDIVTIRINGGGPAGTVLATADSQGHVRGLVSNPAADLPSRAPGKLDVGQLVGKDGYLEVIKDMGLKEAFVGKISLVSGEVAEDLTEYFSKSEQIPSLVSLGVLVDTDLTVKAAGGLIIQALPGAEDTILETIENNVFAMGPLTSVLETVEKMQDIVDIVMRGIEYNIVGEEELLFKCKCSRERLATVIAAMPDEELHEAFEEKGHLEVVCNFCNEHYKFSAEEILAVKNEKP